MKSLRAGEAHFLIRGGAIRVGRMGTLLCPFLSSRNLAALPIRHKNQPARFRHGSAGRKYGSYFSGIVGSHQQMVLLPVLVLRPLL